MSHMKRAKIHHQSVLPPPLTEPVRREEIGEILERFRRSVNISGPAVQMAPIPLKVKDGQTSTDRLGADFVMAPSDSRTGLSSLSRLISTAAKECLPAEADLPDLGTEHNGTPLNANEPGNAFLTDLRTRLNTDLSAFTNKATIIDGLIADLETVPSQLIFAIDEDKDEKADIFESLAFQAHLGGIWPTAPNIVRRGIAGGGGNPDFSVQNGNMATSYDPLVSPDITAQHQLNPAETWKLWFDDSYAKHARGKGNTGSACLLDLSFTAPEDIMAMQTSFQSALDRSPELDLAVTRTPDNELRRAYCNTFVVSREYLADDPAHEEQVEALKTFFDDIRTHYPMLTLAVMEDRTIDTNPDQGLGDLFG